jgi:hypothetical protein
MPQQDADGSEPKESEEVLGVPFPSGREASEALEPGEDRSIFQRRL